MKTGCPVKRLRIRRRFITVILCLVAASHVLGFIPCSCFAQAAERRVNVPNVSGQPFTPAIFWLGSVGMTSNYADVRVWYIDDHYIHFVFHIPDRLLWYDAAPSASTLTQWDAVSVLIDLGGNTGQAPAQTSYWFVKQLFNDGSPGSKAVFRGNGTGWVSDTASFTATSTWRGNYPNDDVWDMGWEADIEIPFSSLGLTGPPASGTRWGLGVIVHDRDDAAGTAIPDQVWPENMQTILPASWGQMQFGLPVFMPQASQVAGTTTVRQGLEGSVVPDAAVGGHTICGDSMNAWTEWGNANYAGYTQFNIQNQWDIADFMCFSKYYVTFPLTSVPAGKGIVSAHVTLNLFGNAGYNPGDAQPSAIDALIVSEDWNESMITWNNAPYATENVSVTWVYPVDASHPAGPYVWDVSYAAADAYAKGQPLRLAFYSTDGDYHSGKYFYTSDSDDWGGTVRPTLEVNWGDRAASSPCDVDGDGISDIAVWRSSSGIWYALPSNTPGTYTATQWGLPGDKPIPGDYDGDGKTDFAVWRPSTGVWYVLPSNTSGTYTATQWGLSSDVPVSADCDGDGTDDIAVWRPGNAVWYVLPSSSAGTYTAIQWGVNTDIPVPGYFDGDDKADVAVWRPATGVWYILESSVPGSYIGTQWGTSSDIPAPGNYDADAKTDIAVWRPSEGMWYILASANPGTYTATSWGLANDIPVSADYDGDGKTDISVWRPGTGVWYILNSGSAGTYTAVQWGVETDVAISPLAGILRLLP